MTKIADMDSANKECPLVIVRWLDLAGLKKLKQMLDKFETILEMLD